MVTHFTERSEGCRKTILILADAGWSCPLLRSSQTRNVAILNVYWGTCSPSLWNDFHRGLLSHPWTSYWVWLQVLEIGPESAHSASHQFAIQSWCPLRRPIAVIVSIAYWITRESLLSSGTCLSERSHVAREGNWAFIVLLGHLLLVLVSGKVLSISLEGALNR